MTKRIAASLKQLPATPGVYQFLDAKKTIIYVGKAANLKSRVGSYFRKSADLSPVKQQMVDAVIDIKIITTESEIEALLLEANLIKKLQPYYNVTLRDDKSYIYVKIATEEAWPRVLTTRTIDRSGTYFGPFTSANAVRETLRVLRKFLPYRCNQKPIDPNLSPKTYHLKPRACFWYHLGLCPGTCIGAVSRRTYAEIVRNIILFFEGRKKELIRSMRKDMGYERIAMMENVLAHTRVLSVGEQYASDTRDLARVLGVSALHRIEGYDISNIMGREAVGSMVVFLDGEPAKSEYKKFKIKTVHGANDVAMLEEVLTRRLQHAEWSLPDLMIIDGGKAQRNAALRVVGNHISIIAIAKGGHGGVLAQKEEIYFPGEAKPLKLPNASPALHLVLRIRDEAHRFAIGYHKTLRKKKFFT